VKVLVENHGGNDRQVDVGVRLRQTGLSKGMKAGYAVVGLLALAANVHSIAVLFGAALLVTESFLSYQAYRMGRTVYHAVEITFQSLPLDPLRPDKTLERPQG